MAKAKTREELAEELENLKKNQDKTLAEAVEKALEEQKGKFADTLKEYEEKMNVEYQNELNKIKSQKVKYVTASNPKAVLFGKLAKAIGKVERIEKNGFNSFFNYKYANEGDILDGIRPILADCGLALWTTIEEEKRHAVETFYKGKSNGKKTITKVSVRFIIGCTETGETLQSRYFGEGEDESDKGLYKAYTGATKYFLTKTFLISSGDMIEDAPTDPEFNDTRNDGKQNQNNRNRHKNDNKNDTAPDTGGGAGVQPSKGEILGFWKSVGGTEEKFERYYTRKMGEGVTHAQLLDALRREYDRKQAEAQREQGAEEINEEPPQEEQENDIPIQEMTPEQYLEFVERSYPFELEEEEKQNILEQARQGKRDLHDLSKKSEEGA